MSESGKQMLTFVPPYYSESKIYNEQNEAKGMEFDVLKYIIEDFKNQIVPQTATWCLPMWEELCGITPSSGDALEKRRTAVVTTISTMSPMSPVEFIRQIKTITRENIEIYYTDWDLFESVNNVYVRNTELPNTNGYVVDVVICFPSKTYDLLKFKTVVYNIIPAHLMIRFYAKLNIRSLGTFTHKQLSRYKHSELNNIISVEDVK